MPVSTFSQQHEAMRPIEALEQLDLQRIVHHQIEAVTRRLEQLLLREHAFEQHDGLGDARRAQREPFFEPRDRECIRIGERERRRHEAVPVGIRFHDRHDRRRGARSRIVFRLVRSAEVSMTARMSLAHLRTPSA